MRLSHVIQLVVLVTAGVFFAAGSAHGANISYGITVGATLPAKAASVRVGKETYFVYNGSFYKQLKVGYILVPAPRGATIRALPRGAAKFTIGKVHYYRHGDVYFKGVGKNFQVCDAPAGAPATAAAPEPAQITVQLGENHFVFRNGRFFLQSPDGLLGRSTPIGATTDGFPPDAMSVWFRDAEYFEANGVFFQEVAGGFKVVPPPWQSPVVQPTEAIAQATSE